MTNPCLSIPFKRPEAPTEITQETLQYVFDTLVHDLNPDKDWFKEPVGEEVKFLNQCLITWYRDFLCRGDYRGIRTFILKCNLTDFKLQMKVLPRNSYTYELFEVYSTKYLPRL